jgi:hypothetical protein
VQQQYLIPKKRIVQVSFDKETYSNGDKELWIQLDVMDRPALALEFKQKIIRFRIEEFERIVNVANEYMKERKKAL